MARALKGKLFPDPRSLFTYEPDKMSGFFVYPSRAKSGDRIVTGAH